MSRILFILMMCVALPASAGGFDEAVQAIFAPIASVLAQVVFYKVTIAGATLPLIVLWLIAGGCYFTLRLGFINIFGLCHSINIARGKYDDPNGPGEVSHLQGLFTAISGTVGIGNIGGVAVAIAWGGPGAAFWLTVAGFLAMSTKFAECALATIYRNEYSDGTVSGGPMYTLEKGLAEGGYARIGKCLGMLYAIGIVIACLGGGNMFQSNQAFEQFLMISGGDESFFVGKGWLFGGVLATLVGAVIIGGIKSIVKVTEKLVPFMALWYLLCALVVIGTHLEALPAVFSMIIEGAFYPSSVAGGMLGVLIIGFQRGVFSNEAGIGSAAIAHSAVKTKKPITQGYVSMLEPLIDTIFICNITAIVICISIYYDPTFATAAGAPKGVALTSSAFSNTLSWFSYPLAFAVLMFALSTMIAWSYYGLKGWTYLFGEGRVQQVSFQLIFCIFIAVGCMTKLGAILDFSDAMLFVICVPNLIGLYWLTPKLKRALKEYHHQAKADAASEAHQ